MDEDSEGRTSMLGRPACGQDASGLRAGGRLREPSGVERRAHTRSASALGPRLAALLVLGATSAACGPSGPTALAATEEDGGLLLVAGTFDRTCGELTSILFECGRWELFVHVASAAPTGGPLPLDSPEIWSQSFMSDGHPGGTECTLWGDIFTQGTVEITGTTAGTVSYTIAGTATGNFDADGDYDAVRCEAP